MVGRASRVRRGQADGGRTPLAAHADSPPTVKAEDLPTAGGVQMANRVAQRHRFRRIALDHHHRVLHDIVRTRPNKNHTVQ